MLKSNRKKKINKLNLEDGTLLLILEWTEEMWAESTKLVTSPVGWYY
jgi:hypothetical protein